MKKIVLVIAIIFVAAGIFYIAAFGASKPSSTTVATLPTQTVTPKVSSDSSTTGSAPVDMSDGEEQGERAIVDEVSLDKSATDLYKDYDSALAAIKKGAVDYDDLTLEQFSDLPENCSWCSELFAAAKDMMQNPTTPSEQRSFYAELLAVSGRPDNLKTLIDSAKGSATQEDRDLYMQALELAQGGDKVAPFLSDQLKDPSNDQVKESLVAGLTNQGSRLSTELLYDYIESKGDPDAFYSVGTGPGEVVPQPEVYPYLQEKILKRDKYSGLAVKSLLNAGVDGLKLVMTSIANSPSPDMDRKMLEGSVDHLSFDEDSVAYLRTLKDSSPDPFVKEIAEKYLAVADAEAANDKEIEAAPDGGDMVEGEGDSDQ